MTYGALFLDLFAVFLLVNRRTRVFVFLLIIVFHFMNSRLFNIGIFPWMMIAATAIFFPPAWPRRILKDMKRVHPFRIPSFVVGFAFGFLIGGVLPSSFSPVQALIGAIGVAIAAYHLDEPFRVLEAETTPIQQSTKGTSRQRNPRSKELSGLEPMKKWALTLLGIWVAAQLLVSFRHFAVAGNVHWTEESRILSWHMMLRTKTTFGEFVVTDRLTREVWLVDPGDYLTSLQQKRMSSRPNLILEFARPLENELRAEGHEDGGPRPLFRFPQRQNTSVADRPGGRPYPRIRTLVWTC